MTPEEAQDALSDYRHSTSIGGPRVLETFKEAVATVAAQTWEYGVEWDSPHSPGVRLIEWPWGRAEDDAREFMTSSPPLQNPRLVRRLVGPVEVVEG